MADTASDTSEGLLPEPNSVETIRNLMPQRQRAAISRRRVLLISLVSVGLHLFLLPFVLTITVTFDEQLFSAAADDVYTQGGNGNDIGWEMDLERDYAVSGVDGGVVPTFQSWQPMVEIIPQRQLVEDPTTDQQVVKQEIEKAVSERQQPEAPIGVPTGTNAREQWVRDYYVGLSQLTDLLATVVDEQSAKSAAHDMKKHDMKKLKQHFSDLPLWYRNSPAGRRLLCSHPWRLC